MTWRPLYIARANQSYHSNHLMDLELQEGDMIQVMGTENDYWVNGKNLRSLRFGSIPVSYLSRDHLSNANSLLGRDTRKSVVDRDKILDKHALDFKLVDAFARDVHPVKESSTQTLSNYLASFSSDRILQFRAFYVWITNNIEYDVHGFLSGKIGPQDAESVLKIKRAVCQGYAELFMALCQHARLPAEIISGYAKGVGSRAGIAYTVMVGEENIPEQKDGRKSNHAWNAVELPNGQHFFVECTWGAGHLGSKNTFVKEYNDFYFLVDPQQMIYRHFPDDTSKQYLDLIRSEDEFMAFPFTMPDFFKFDCKLVYPKGLPMLSVLDVYDTPVKVGIQGNPKLLKTSAILQWPKCDPSTQRQALAQILLEKDGSSTVHITCICPEFGQGILSLFGSEEATGTLRPLCMFLVRNSGIFCAYSSGTLKNENSTIFNYMSGKFYVHGPIIERLSMGDSIKFSVQEYDGELHMRRGEQELVLLTPSRKVLMFSCGRNGIYTLDHKVQERGAYNVGLKTGNGGEIQFICIYNVE